MRLSISNLPETQKLSNIKLVRCLMRWGLKESKDYVESILFINGVATIELDVEDGAVFTINLIPTKVSVENVQAYINDLNRSGYQNIRPVVSLAGKKPRLLIRDLEKQIVRLQADLVWARKEKNDLNNSLQNERNIARNNDFRNKELEDTNKALRIENVELKKKIDEMGKGSITKDGMSFETFDDYIEIFFKTKVYSINDFHDTMTVLKKMLDKNGA